MGNPIKTCVNAFYVIMIVRDPNNDEIGGFGAYVFGAKSNIGAAIAECVLNNNSGIKIN